MRHHCRLTFQNSAMVCCVWKNQKSTFFEQTKPHLRSYSDESPMCNTLCAKHPDCIKMVMSFRNSAQASTIQSTKERSGAKTSTKVRKLAGSETGYSRSQRTISAKEKHSTTIISLPNYFARAKSVSKDKLRVK